MIGSRNASVVNYPSLLKPTSTHEFRLSGGRAVAVAKATPAFSLWCGEPPGDTYGGKPILDIEGCPGFAELAIVARSVARAGTAFGSIPIKGSSAEVTGEFRPWTSCQTNRVPFLIESSVRAEASGAERGTCCVGERESLYLLSRSVGNEITSRRIRVTFSGRRWTSAYPSIPFLWWSGTLRIATGPANLQPPRQHIQPLYLWPWCSV